MNPRPKPTIKELLPNGDDDYILKIDNPYNTITWTHPGLSIEIILRTSDGSIIKSETQASGIFNLGHLENGDYKLQMYIVSNNAMLIAANEHKSAGIVHEFTISSSPHGPAPTTERATIVQNITYNIHDSSIVSDEFGNIGKNGD